MPMNADPDARDKLLNDLSSTLSPASEPIADKLSPPAVIPDHELIRRIGRGSYGEVWLASSALGTWRAVKIVHRAAFDHDRPYEREFEGIRRFEPVSRTHPSQLNVLHVGRNDAAGHFYYVMELADDAAEPQPSDQCSVINSQSAVHRTASAPLNTDHCSLTTSYIPRTLRSDLYRHRSLPFDECLQIGLALATALDHLHRHKLVHRDIKPSNIIFVNGIPKLADIGLVAQAEATLSAVGTEGYLPPEGPGTPQADIYSLGKVLYEMATGRDRQDYPELPTNLIERPATERAQLTELNEIIVRACHTDLKQRYLTAAELHADLALLQSGKSVSRMRAVERRLRFVQRAGALVTLVALIAATLYLWQARQTRAMRDLAEAKTRLAAENGRLARENRQVAQFLKEMLESVEPSVALGRDTTLLREILEKTAARLGTDLKDQPEVEAELRTTLGTVYRGLGEYERSEAMLREALSIRRKAHGTDLATADSLMELASTLQAYMDRAEAETWHRMFSPTSDAKLTETEALMRQSLEIRRKIQGNESPDIAATLGRLSTVYYDRGELEDAEILAREGLAMAQKFLPEDHPEVVNRKGDLAVVLGDVGKFQEAEVLYRETLAAERRLLGDAHPTVSGLLISLGLLVERQERLAEAAAFYREAVSIERKLGPGGYPLALGRSLARLAEASRRQGKMAEAAAALREALPLKVKLYGEEHLEVAAVLDNLAGVLADQGQLEEAESLSQRALTMRKKLVGEVHPHVAVSYMGLADLRQRQGRAAEAETYLREALAIEQKLDRADRPYVPELAGSSRTVSLLNKLARNLQGQGRFAEAETALRQALDYLRRPTPWGPAPKTPTLGLILHHLAEVHCALQKCEEARVLSLEAVELYHLHPEWSANERNHAFRVYLSVLLNLGDTTTAERVYRDAIAAERTLVGGSGAVVAQYLGDLAAVLQSNGRLAESETAFREALAELRKDSETAGQSELAAMILHHLADALRQRESFAEARSLAEESLSLYRRHPEWPQAERQHAGFVLKDILLSQGDLEAAEAICRERLQDVRTEGPPDSLEASSILSELTLVLLANHKFQEAEVVAREGLEIRQKKIPDDWRTFNSQSLLGGALLGQKKYAEAKPLLLSGYEGMQQRETQVPPQGKLRLPEALQRLVKLCDETGQPEKAEEWRTKLAELNRP